MLKPILTILALFTFLLPTVLPVNAGLPPVGVGALAYWRSPLQEDSYRKPFVLDLPELGINSITATEVIIPRYDLQTFRLRILKPFADAIAYGKIYTTINGESAGTVQNVSASSNGYLVTCNLTAKPHLRLHAGKNVIEVLALGKTAYYASFVLRTGKLGAKETLAQNAVLESITTNTGSDNEAPTIYLTEPKGAVQMLTSTATIKVAGFVTDDSGIVSSVTINGKLAPLSPATQTRNIVIQASKPNKGFLFETQVLVSANTADLRIEAKDNAGNLARLLLPVKKREAAISSQFSGRKFALVIGVSRYKYHEGGLNDLAFADADARSIKEFLQRKEGGGFNANDILYLENEQATIDGVRGALNSFLPKAAPSDLLFIFLAGHGSPDPYAPQKLYFLVHDTKVSNMEMTALPMNELKDMLDGRVRAERVVVFVDTCHSAGLSGRQIVNTRSLENNLINLYASKLYKETGRAVLTSSDVNETSQESMDWGGGHGVFTFTLLEGLGGKADFNSDRLITAGELFTYVRDRVSIETAFHQNPTALPGLNKDLTLAFVARK